MNKYKQLTTQERYQIFIFLEVGFSEALIAKKLGRHRSTIGREINRNKSSGKYWPEKANQKAKKRKRSTHKYKKITLDMKEKIREYLEQKWSPEQIYGYCKKDGIDMVSHETIYQYIWQDKEDGGDLYKHLRHAKKKRKKYGSKEKRGQIKDRVSIDKRPEIVNLRIDFGHWEGDLMVSGKDGKGVLITMVEMISGLLLACYVESKDAKKVSDALIAMMLPFASYVKSITFDNGKEFAKHKKIEKALNAKVYFAHPYSSWERGTNENTNGLIRQYLPKGTSFETVSQEEITKVNAEINLRPRKRLGYDCPAKVFDAQVSRAQNVR